MARERAGTTTPVDVVVERPMNVIVAARSASPAFDTTIEELTCVSLAGTPGQNQFAAERDSVCTNGIGWSIGAAAASVFG